MTEPETIRGWHAHVYFDPSQRAAAEAVAGAAARRFDLALGHFHGRPIGPHPTGSVQLSVPVTGIGEVLGWLALNRQGLTLMIHPDTGDDLADHRDRVLWMGAPLPLNLALFGG